MTGPAGIDAELRAALRAAFTPPELVELSLDVMAFNKQKVSVALGTDRAVAEDALTELVFDDDGHFRFGRQWRPDTAA
jgi:hypothetical protein